MHYDAVPDGITTYLKAKENKEMKIIVLEVSERMLHASDVYVIIEIPYFMKGFEKTYKHSVYHNEKMVSNILIFDTQGGLKNEKNN